MPKEKKDRFRLSDGARAILFKTIIISICVLAVLAIVGLGFAKVQHYVGDRVAYATQPPKVVLKERPAWMSDFLAEQICRAATPPGGHSPLDRNLLRNVRTLLRENARTAAWIKEVRQLRLEYGEKPGDTLVLDCEFRVPTALVEHDGLYYLVDADGAKLPDAYTAQQVNRIVYGRDGRVNIRVVEGVESDQPQWPGEIWKGDDLGAALEMAKVLHGQDFAEEIVRIDVSNFKGRQSPRDSQIVLITRRNTQIRWGQPASSTDLAEVSGGEKVRRLQQIFAEKGRVDAGHAWIDIRTDIITRPTAQPTASTQ